MMIRILQLLSALPLSSAEILPNIFQIDILLPKIVQTYKPTYPFPIIYILNNPSLLHNFTTARLNWTLYPGEEQFLEYYNISAIDFGSINIKPPISTPSNGNASTAYILIESSKQLKVATNSSVPRQYILQTDLEVLQPHCVNDVAFKIQKYMTFNISATGQSVTDALLSTSGKCSEPLGGVSIGISVVQDDCAFGSTPRKIESCSGMADQALVDDVSMKMRQLCSQWPNATSEEECNGGKQAPARMSSGSRLKLDMYTLALMVFLLFYIL